MRPNIKVPPSLFEMSQLSPGGLTTLRSNDVIFVKGQDGLVMEVTPLVIVRRQWNEVHGWYEFRFYAQEFGTPIRVLTEEEVAIRGNDIQANVEDDQYDAAINKLYNDNLIENMHENAHQVLDACRQMQEYFQHLIGLNIFNIPIRFDNFPA